jgi:acetylornithine deacetylase/succinyl-diaminopimelate desuccinylase-like protein
MRARKKTLPKARSTGSRSSPRPGAKSSRPHRQLTEPAVLRLIRARTRSRDFQKYIAGLLLELCRIDTTPNPQVEKMRAAEDACFRIIERELSALGNNATLERRPINPAIQKHPHFSLLHFTKTPERPDGLSPETTYEGRSNLVYLLRGAGDQPGLSVALNAHVDVVAPYFPPRLSKGTVYGRGACDDKGPVVSILAALKVLSEILAAGPLRLNQNVLAMFVVEEETGGNGSLSLAIDRELKQMYDSILVCECTGLKTHPANRGAVWYRAQLRPPEGVSALELAAFVVEELEKEGAAIRAESAHRLFPQRPVQTCHGIIGPFGEHPSRICGEVSFKITAASQSTDALEQLVRDCLDSGLAAYTGLYGDKSEVIDPATGRPMVARHYDLRQTDSGFEVHVHGATGHMGAIRERDGAITKMAHLVRSLVYSKPRLERLAGAEIRIDLTGRDAVPDVPFLLEGGQGFVPTHGIDEIMQRLRQAAQRGAQHYLDRLGRTESAADLVTITYEKLHNVAFDGDPDSLSMRNALAAARACGLLSSTGSERGQVPLSLGKGAGVRGNLPFRFMGRGNLRAGLAKSPSPSHLQSKHDPVLGWTVSCDARLFASEYPGLQVLTFGPGQLAFAHSDHEQISLQEIQAAVEFLVLFLMRQTGTLAE